MTGVLLQKRVYRGVLTCAGLLALTGSSAGDPGPSFPKLSDGATLSYRQKLTGMLPSPGKELRWSLSVRGKSVKLTARSRTCPAPRIGKALQAVPPCTEPLGPTAVSYAGRLDQRPYGVDIWVQSEKPADGFPGELNLHCLRSVIGVLPVGAMLQPGDACKGDGPPPRWQPASTQDVAVWYCAVRDEANGPWNGYQVVGPLVFAASAGVEWVYVNNDCAGQEGAFRLPAPDK